MDKESIKAVLLSCPPNYSKLPEHIRGGVKRYVEEGVLPGSFLRAVICNQLKESFMLADETNIARMFDIVGFFYNEVPSGCWGSPEKMKKWAEMYTKGR